MTDQNRQYKRIVKKITLRFCVADVYPQKWDMSIVENISAGGVKFTVLSDLALNDKMIRLQIKVPEMAPLLLELEAMVLDVKPRAHTIISDVRAKFINLSEENKENLSILGKMIEGKDKKI